VDGPSCVVLVDLVLGIVLVDVAVLILDDVPLDGVHIDIVVLILDVVLIDGFIRRPRLMMKSLIM